MNYGPNADAINFIVVNQVSQLTPERAMFVMMMTDLVEKQDTARHAALRAARTIPGREAATMRASEAMRKSVWDAVWDSTHDEAWRVAWAAANCGIGVATLDLVGTAEYTEDHYLALVGPWLSGGFGDIPIRKEEQNVEE